MHNDDPVEQFELSPWPERIFTFLGAVTGILGFVLAGWSVKEELPPKLILCKDLFIFVTLLTLVLYYYYRYRYVLGKKKEQKTLLTDQLKEIRALIQSQTGLYQNLMAGTREALYVKFNRAGIYPHRFNYRKKELNKVLEDMLRSTLTSLNNILKTELATRTPPINVPVSLSVKAIVTPQMAAEICKLSTQMLSGLSESKKYVMTLERDPDTRAKFQDREVRAGVFDCEKNTDFYRILHGEIEFFLANDLPALAKGGWYLNDNPNWETKYTATLVVPIGHKDPARSESILYGFLTADALPKEAVEVFSSEMSKPILTFGADLLALVFLYLETNDSLPESIK